MSTSIGCTGENGKNPLVSVIMNCYNGEKFLQKAVDSVLAQTYKNLEIIFWDNQSYDNSAKIFKSYVDSRLKYFYSPSHTLLYEARDLALKKSSGEFIAFLDVDDWWEMDKLERQIPLFDDEEIGLVYGNFWLLNKLKSSPRKIAHTKALPTGKVLNQLLEEYVIGMLTLVVRRRALEGLEKVFDSRFQIIGDLDMTIRLSVNWKAACIQAPVANYRHHENNLSMIEGDRWFEELELWAIEMKDQSAIASQIGFANIFLTIDYLKIMNALMLNERWKALFLLSSYPFCIRKLKLFAAILMPMTIIKTLRAGAR